MNSRHTEGSPGMLRKSSIVCVLICFSSLAMAAEGIIWVEGEQAVKKQLVDNPGLNDVNPDELSGGRWICSFSHDDKPIRESERVLAQAGTLCRPTGWTVVPTRARIDGKQSDCFRILSVGKAPLQVENIEAVLTIANPRLSKATLLDINGMATSTPVDVQQAEGKVTIRLPTNTIYLVLQ